jgi:hypothetical protein
LRLPQEVIAQAIIIFARFWVGPEGGSLSEFGAEVSCSLHRTNIIEANPFTANISLLSLSCSQTLCLPEISTQYRECIRVPKLHILRLYVFISRTNTTEQ